MHLFNKNIFLVSIVFFLYINSTSFAMDEDRLIDRQDREQAVLQAIALLENTLHTIKTAYTLCFDAGQTLLGKAQAPLSDALMEDAKKWMGSTVNLGFDHQWPAGVLENKEFLALHFFHATNIWLKQYEEITSYRNFLLHFGAEVITRFHNGLEGYLRVKKVPQRRQTDLEIAMFGEYPSIDYDALYEALSKILPLLKPFLEKDASPDIQFQKTELEKKSDLMQKKYQSKLTDNEDTLWLAVYQIIAHQIFLNKDTHRINSLTDNHDLNKAIRVLKIIKTTTRRKDFVEKNQKDAYEGFLALFLERTQTENKQEETVTNRPVETKNIVRIKPNKKNNKKKKKKNNIRQSISTTQIEKTHVDTKSHDDSLEQTEKPMANDTNYTVSKEVQPDEESLETLSNAIQDEETYIWDPEAEKKEFQNYTEIKNKLMEKRNTQPKPSIYPLNPYLTQSVVEKFLDILGNEKGAIRKNNCPPSLYQRQGWGTIKDFQDILISAGWLNNRKETESGIKKEKHRSSTISFRMPNSFKDMTAPIIKFHDDHGVSSQVMREITRHFIRESLTYFGYTEDFLLGYYKENFTKF